MSRILVLGVGSLLMKDDGVGTLVVAALGSELRALGIFALAGETDVSFCLDHILPDDYLILVDAALRGSEPGSIFVLPLTEAAQTLGKAPAQHDFSVLYAAMQHLPGLRGQFIGIEAAEIGYGFTLSKPLDARFKNICAEVLCAISQIQAAYQTGPGTDRLIAPPESAAAHPACL